MYCVWADAEAPELASAAHINQIYYTYILNTSISNHPPCSALADIWPS